MKRLAVISIAVLASIAGVLIFLAYERGVTVVAAFDEAPGIFKGSKVMHRGIPVGEVRGLERDTAGKTLISITIYEEFQDEVNSSSVFILGSPDFGSDSGAGYLTAKVLDEKAPPFIGGQRTRGYASNLDFILKYGKSVLEEAMESIEEMREERDERGERGENSMDF